MKPRINYVTLGVADLERSLRFYRDGLGLRTEGIIGAEIENGAVAFFELNGGLILALWPRISLANEAKVPLGPVSATEFTLAHNVGSKDEVDAVFAEATRAGATATAAPVDKAWGGYGGFVQDPEGHLWEIAWNPDLVLTE